MRITKTFFVAVLVLVWGAGVIGCGGGPEPKPILTPVPTPSGNQVENPNSNNPLKDVVLKIGRIPFTNATEIVRKQEALANYLKEELGVKEIHMITAPDYNGILTRLEKDELQIGWLGTVPYIEGKEKYKLKALVKPIRFKTTSYRGIIITRQDSGIRNLGDLKGKRFAYTEKESASGYIFPKVLLIQAGINPEKDFTETTFLQKHDSVVLNVFLGKWDAGACYDDARTTLKDKDKQNQLTIIAKTEDIPNEPIVCREDFPADLAEKIKQAFLKLKIDDPRYRKVLEDCTDVQGFTTVTDSDYDVARSLLKVYRKESR